MNDNWQGQQSNEFNDLPVHLVIGKIVPASEDAVPDELALHVVRLLQNLATQQLLLPNMLMDDAIIHVHQEKTVRLSLESFYSKENILLI